MGRWANKLRLWYHSVMRRSRAYGDVTRRIYVGQKYRHIYTLSISTCKNQSMKVRGALYILTYEHNYKVIIGCDIILQEYTSLIGTNTRIQRDTRTNRTKDAHKLLKEKLRSLARGLEGNDSRWSADDPRFCYGSLISNWKNPQAPNSRTWTCRSRGVRNSPTSFVMNTKWCAGSSTRVSINLNQKHALKIMSWAYTLEHEWGIKWCDIHMWQN